MYYIPAKNFLQPDDSPIGGSRSVSLLVPVLSVTKLPANRDAVGPYSENREKCAISTNATPVGGR
jgi:hypothetical protein